MTAFYDSWDIPGPLERAAPPFGDWPRDKAGRMAACCVNCPGGSKPACCQYRPPVQIVAGPPPHGDGRGARKPLTRLRRALRHLFHHNTL